LKAGKNIFVIRVTNNAGKGGFVPDKPYCLFAEGDTLDLKGSWQYKVGDVFAPRPPGASGIVAQSQPTSLYNAMVAPVINYTIKDSFGTRVKQIPQEPKNTQSFSLHK
jgi:sialate O-acetylesterase